MLMQRFTIYLTLLLLLLSAGVSAQHPEAMNVQTNIGADQSILLEKIKNIEFVEECLVFLTTSGTFQIKMDDLKNIIFGKYNGNSSTNIANIDDNSMHILLQGNELFIESEYAIKALYLVDITGKLIVSQKLSSLNETTIILPTSGVFVLFLETNQGYVARKILNN